MSFPLPQLPKGVPAIVQRVKSIGSNDCVALRLGDLGFLPGEPIRITARAPFSADPLLAQIGTTRIALRLTEAARILVREDISDAA